ncbi:MAG TPA: DUF2007 domain-containing protein [Stenotrophomonas sp.]|nr:DUF2007 domain-containing protein [Stenotrophomonas sp.]
MRKVFSSQRVETAEGVAKLLREAGIDVRLTNGRSYRSRRSGQFSYLEEGSAQLHPTVWVVRADDQPRARELLREARLLDTTRRDLPFAQYAFAETPEAQAAGTRNWAWRIRIGLLVVIGVVAMFIMISMKHRHAAPTVAPAAPVATPAQPAAAPPAASPQQTPPDDTSQDDPSRVRIQPAQ